MDAGVFHPWQLLFPPLQPHDGGWLDVGDGHAVRWDVAGHPSAPAALVLHGGPGAGCTPADRRWFDPARWRIVTLDQRGCGHSRARQPLLANTTPLLVDDIEALRLHLAVDRWVLFGGSWGSTLALAYAERHPQRVGGLVLRGVFTATRAETDWLYGAAGAALRLPAAWQRLTGAAGVEPGGSLLDALQARLDAGGAAALTAARAWCDWEHDLIDAERAVPVCGAAAGADGAIAAPAAVAAAAAAAAAAAPAAAAAARSAMSVPAAGIATQLPAVAAAGSAAPVEAAAAPVRHPRVDDAAVLTQARIGVHYARAGWFLAEGKLLADAHRLRGVPGVIVQGGCDLVTPPATARALHAVWPESTLHEVAGAGHASGHPTIARHLIDALRQINAIGAHRDTPGDERHG